MNKLQIMKQRSVDDLIAWAIGDKPGITSERLWALAKEWDHKLIAADFDDALSRALKSFRVTNKQWYPPNHQAPPKVSTGKKEDPRQVRMDW